MDISAILIMLIVLSILFLYTWCTAPKEEHANFFKLWGVIFIVYVGIGSFVYAVVSAEEIPGGLAVWCRWVMAVGYGALPALVTLYLVQLAVIGGETTRKLLWTGIGALVLSALLLPLLGEENSALLAALGLGQLIGLLNEWLWGNAERRALMNICAAGKEIKHTEKEVVYLKKEIEHIEKEFK